MQRFVFVFLFCALSMVPVAAFSQSPGAQVAQLMEVLDQQDSLDVTGAASKDRQLARKWLGEAQVALESGGSGAFEKKFRKAQFGVELVTALVAAATIRLKADEQEAAALTAPQMVEKLRADIEALNQRKTKLNQELKQLRGKR